MKTTHLLSFLLLSVLISCSGNDNTIVITGKLTGVEDGTVFFLSRVEGNMGIPIATDTLKNGMFQFEFADSADVATNLKLVARGDGYPAMPLDVWVKPGARIKITGNDKMIGTWNVESNVSEQKEHNKYKAKTKELDIRVQTILLEYYALFDEIRQQPERGDELRTKARALSAEMNSLYLDIYKKEIDLLVANPTYSEFWMKKLNTLSMYARNIADFPYKEPLKNLYSGLSNELKNSQQGLEIGFNLFPPTVVKVGEEMADADMYDVDGNLHRLADYKGKYILLDFWSRGCGPCIAAIPEMKNIAEKYKDKLTIVSISSDTKEQWIEASLTHGISWANFNEFKGSNGLFARYGVSGIPNYHLIAPDGIINSSWMGYGTGSLLAKMEELIK